MSWNDRECDQCGCIIRSGDEFYRDEYGQVLCPDCYDDVYRSSDEEF